MLSAKQFATVLYRSSRSPVLRRSLPPPPPGAASMAISARLALRGVLSNALT